MPLAQPPPAAKLEQRHERSRWGAGDSAGIGDVSAGVARLAALVDVSVQWRNWFDWTAIEGSLGMRLPADYKELVSVFPDGWFQGLVQLNRPGDHFKPATEFLGFYADKLNDMRALRSDGHPFPYPIFPEPGGLLPWAHGRRLQPFFWITGVGDPDAWPVVAADYDLLEWWEFPGPACEALVEVVEGRFDSRLHRIEPETRAPYFESDEEAVEPSTGPSASFWKDDGRAVNEFAALAEVIGPPPARVRPVDWAEIHEFMGVRLPADYRSFIDTYGPGSLGDITITVPGGPDGFDLYKLLARAYAAAQAPGVIRTAPVCPEPDGMKELRPPSTGRTEIRILFVLDPWRSAILLVAGDKSGQWNRWYRDAIPEAERFYATYLKEREQEFGS